MFSGAEQGIANAKFKNLLQSETFEEVYHNSDPNITLDMIYTKYSQAYERSFPLVMISRKIMKDKKWITPGIRIKINQKAYLYRSYLNYPTERNKTIYKKYRNILTSIIRKAKKMYYQH